MKHLFASNSAIISSWLVLSKLSCQKEYDVIRHLMFQAFFLPTSLPKYVCMYLHLQSCTSIYLLQNKSAFKWTPTVQTSVVQRSTLLQRFVMVSALEMYIVYSFSSLVSFQVFTHQSIDDSLLKRRKHSKVQVSLLFYYMWKTIILLWLFCFLVHALHFVPKPSQVIPLALHFYILDPSWLPATTPVFPLPSSISA